MRCRMKNMSASTALVLKVYAEYLRYSRNEARRLQGLARCLGKTNASVTEAAMWMRKADAGIAEMAEKTQTHQRK